jgi:hypothetical protein
MQGLLCLAFQHGGSVYNNSFVKSSTTLRRRIHRLNKHNTVKMYWGSGAIVPRIVNFGTRWDSMVSFRPRLHYSREKSHGTHWIGGWMDPGADADLDAVAKIKKFFLSPYRESNPCRPARSLSTILTELHRCPIKSLYRQ